MTYPDDDGGYIPSSQSSQMAESQGSQTRMLKNTGSGTGAWDTPIAIISMTETSGQTYSVSNKTTEARYLRLAEEMASRFVGPMPPDDFLDIFLRRREISKEGMPSTSDAFVKVPEKASEVAIYEAMIEALNNCERCPGFKFYDTHLHPDTAGPAAGNNNNVKPDICCYADGHATLVKTPKDMKDDAAVKNAHMGFAALYFEIKGSKSQDFFRDPTEGADRTTWEFVSQNGNAKRQQDLGQAISYAVEVCKRQHRHCCYSVSMSGSHTRLIRWDRAGAIVTESFDIRKTPQLLCDFLWCFARVSDAERGYDLTVRPATEAQEMLFRNAIEKHIPTQVATRDPLHLEQLLNEHYQEGAVTLISLPPSSESDFTELLISRPIVVPLSVTGRCTRAYWAVDPQSERVVFLKDTWRYDMHTGGGPQKTECEGDVLRLLEDAHVQNIPSVLYDHDVPLAYETVDDSGDEFSLMLDDECPQTTLTQDYLDQHCVCGGSLINSMVVKHTHYRMVLDVVGYTLLRLRGTAELLTAAYDAFQALKDAYEQARWIHRDVSPGNIILYNPTLDPQRVGYVRRGYLVDWDLSRGANNAGLRREYEVSATWQFLSLSICRDSRPNAEHPMPSVGPVPDLKVPIKRLHTLEDDMESIIYSVLYCALLWTPHNCHGDRLRITLRQLFDAYDVLDSLPRGGDGKSSNAMSRTYTQIIRWNSQVFAFWLDTVLDYHAPIADVTPADRYGKWTAAHLEEFWKNLLATHPSLPVNDWVDNIRLDPKAFNNHMPQHAHPNPNQGTHASPQNSLKRVVEHTLDFYRPTKRPREDLEENEYSSGTEEASASIGTGSAPPESWGGDVSAGAASEPSLVGEEHNGWSSDIADEIILRIQRGREERNLKESGAQGL